MRLLLMKYTKKNLSRFNMPLSCKCDRCNKKARYIVLISGNILDFIFTFCTIHCKQFLQESGISKERMLEMLEYVNKGGKS